MFFGGISEPVSFAERQAALLRHVGGVRFGRGGEIEAGLDDRELALGRAEEIVGVLGGEALDQRLRVGEADILDRGAGQPAEQVERLLAGGQHPREIVERRLRVGAADRFVKRGDEVVMALAVLVVDRDPAVEQGRRAPAGSSGSAISIENRVSAWLSRKRPSPSAVAISASRASGGQRQRPLLSASARSSSFVERR